VATATSKPAATPGRVQVFAAHHRLEHTTAHGSMVAPATSDRVVAVGAAANGEHLAYSSLSATGSVDLTAPDGARTRADPTLAGTSAAAPYVAGTAALVEAAGRDPSPARVEAILERTADDEGSTVDALAAVEAASASGELATDGGQRVDPSPVTAESGDDAGTWSDVTASPDPDRGSTDSTAGTSPTRSADESARNVTRPADDGRRSGADDGSDERDGDDPNERNRDDDTDRTGDRDGERSGDGGESDGSTASGDQRAGEER
jgi:hypothetical protein